MRALAMSLDNPYNDLTLVPGLVVYPPEEPEYSGLVDSRGYPLVRPVNKVGFLTERLPMRPPKRQRT